MKLKEITLQNVKSFLTGTTRSMLNRLGLVSEHIQEQVLYRADICKNDCAKRGKCIKCGCSVPGKWFANISCNKGERFPNLMDRIKWEKYKKENNINIKL